MQLHDYLTDEEIFKIFHTTRQNVPKYDLATIEFINFDQTESPVRAKRHTSDNKVSFEAFGKLIELNLELTDHVLYGSATPLYIASYTGKRFKYERKPFVSQTVEISNRAIH